MKEINLGKLKKFSKKIRKNILFAAKCGGSSSAHIGGALSCADILSVLFFNVMDISKKKYSTQNRDRFILSKGHGCLAYYAALVEKKFLTKKDLETFEKNESDLLGHPVKNRKIGIEFSNGSLGMGLSLAIGVGVSFKKKNIKKKIFVLIGDGECNEGSVWEAAMCAPNFNLNNICVIIDKNNFQQTGSNTKIMNLRNLSNKWKSFGWEVIKIDGHNFEDIYKSTTKISKKPTAIIANTIKGKGFKEFENNNDWHHKIVTQSHYKKLIREIDDYK